MSVCYSSNTQLYPTEATTMTTPTIATTTPIGCSSADPNGAEATTAATGSSILVFVQVAKKND